MHISINKMRCNRILLRRQVILMRSHCFPLRRSEPPSGPPPPSYARFANGPEVGGTSRFFASLRFRQQVMDSDYNPAAFVRLTRNRSRTRW